jgi:drug/metabolite transporter (DMT)-like permease
VAVIARPTSGLGAAQLLPGVGACLTATACYGLAGFLTRRWIQQRGGLEAERVALGSQVGATLFCALLSLVLLAWAGVDWGRVCRGWQCLCWVSSARRQGISSISA